MKDIRTAVVVGNPKPASRTLAASTHLLRELTGTDPDLVVDLATVGPALLDWSSPEVADLVRECYAEDVRQGLVGLLRQQATIQVTVP